MAYIGNQPAESFTSFATQEFSTSATTSYTLNHAVTNENEIALFVNNVRQQPGSGKAYTATGTALTLSAATASTDTMYCVFLGRALQTVTPATNSITNAMITDSTIESGKLFSTFKNGITMAQMWRITSSLTVSTEQDLSVNWEVADTAPTSALGTGLSQASGVFTFPSTGYYWVAATVGMRRNSGTRNAAVIIAATTNNSSYTNVAYGELSNSDFGGSDNTSISAYTQYMFDITDTTNQKFKIRVVANQDQTVDGSSTQQYTGFQIIRLGDT